MDLKLKSKVVQLKTDSRLLYFLHLVFMMLEKLLIWNVGGYSDLCLRYTWVKILHLFIQMGSEMKSWFLYVLLIILLRLRSSVRFNTRKVIRIIFACSALIFSMYVKYDPTIFNSKPTQQDLWFLSQIDSILNNTSLAQEKEKKKEHDTSG
jgi:hypothetical protein